MKSTASKLAQGPPIDPLRDVISSERYLDSLEKRLNKVKGKQLKEPTAKEMLSALERAKDHQMAQLLDKPQPSYVDNTCLEGAVINKTHSGQQQNLEEIVAIVYQDSLSKEEEESQKGTG